MNLGPAAMVATIASTASELTVP